MSDATSENQAVVNILGEEYPITGSEDAGYISRVADLVDVRMKEIAASSRFKTKDKLAILTAMSFASELCEKNDDLDGLESEFSSRIKRLVTSLEQTLTESNQGQD